MHQHFNSMPLFRAKTIALAISSTWKSLSSPSANLIVQFVTWFSSYIEVMTLPSTKQRRGWSSSTTSNLTAAFQVRHISGLRSNRRYRSCTIFSGSSASSSSSSSAMSARLLFGGLPVLARRGTGVVEGDKLMLFNNASVTTM